jgi:hypothetical protein
VGGAPVVPLGAARRDRARAGCGRGFLVARQPRVRRAGRTDRGRGRRGRDDPRRLLADGGDRRAAHLRRRRVAHAAGLGPDRARRARRRPRNELQVPGDLPARSARGRRVPPAAPPRGGAGRRRRGLLRNEPVLRRALRECPRRRLPRSEPRPPGMARLRARPRSADRVRRPPLGRPRSGAARLHPRARRRARPPWPHRPDPRLVRRHLLPGPLHPRRALRPLRAPAAAAAGSAGGSLALPGPGHVAPARRPADLGGPRGPAAHQDGYPGGRPQLGRAAREAGHEARRRSFAPTVQRLPDREARPAASERGPPGPRPQPRPVACTT